MYACKESDEGKMFAENVQKVKRNFSENISVISSNFLELVSSGISTIKCHKSYRVGERPCPYILQALKTCGFQVFKIIMNLP